MHTNTFRPLVLAMAIGVLAAAGCSSSSNPSKPMQPANPPGGGSQVTISGDAYSALTVAMGTTVTWKNNDPMTHTATSDTGSPFPFDTGNIAPGATSAGITFTQTGSFAYHCKIHPFMHGVIVVQ